MEVLAWSLPAGSGNFSWRKLGPDNVAEMGSLIHRIEEFDNPPFRTAISEVEEFFAAPSSWRTIGAFGSENNLVAYAQVRPRLLLNEVVCEGGVDPRYRGQGLGRASISWQRDQARALLDHSRPGRALFYVEDIAPELSQLLVDAGYTQTDSFVDVSRDLSHSIEVPALSYPFQIVTWDKELDDLLRQAVNRILEKRKAGAGYTSEDWTTRRGAFTPECSFVALDKTTDRSEIAGFVLSSIYRQDWTAVGNRQGYIDLLGLLPGWENEAILKSLIAVVLTAFKKQGFATVGALLPETADPATRHLFLEAGFKVIGTSTQYAIETPASKEDANSSS
ncbi:GNAT family N-acetyltransferase [Varibaculum cambriense]|uniref:GNAT family N-acetyltransferase n=1 Tax=Varibaculum cambriense TaxID=184870 RepID=UPI0003B34320|nr:GNAT family N-acetyltransferase [Varibaculum cambriense]